MLAVATHFRTLDQLPPGEVTKLYQILALQLTMEAQVRNGILEKHGEYSMRPDGSSHFSLTPKGYEFYGKGDRLKEGE